ncbi:hypothetical protein [Paenibacillus ferrarius]|uniref:hypothetical protein n=1 Tax=Paenibacillus ferrarius TaxID=1469647 RepID=UPI003D2C14C6
MPTLHRYANGMLSGQTLQTIGKLSRQTLQPVGSFAGRTPAHTNCRTYSKFAKYGGFWTRTCISYSKSQAIL